MSRKSILHLMTQEKITPQLIENFSLLNIDNFFLILNGNYIKLENTELTYSLSDFDINRFVEQNSIDGIIIHGLYGHFAKIICDLKFPLKSAWIEWGFDIYNRNEVIKFLYAQETEKYYNKHFCLLNRIKNNSIIRHLYFYITKKNDYNELVIIAQNKINFFCTYIYEDFLFFDKYYNHSTTFFYSPFSTLKQYLAGQENIRINKNAKNILIGNSNSLENNHLDVFRILKLKKTIDNINIVVPLSYGNNIKYKREIINKGTKYFKKSFIPLLDFMPRDAYLELLRNCSTAIFYHYRQQAMGNIIALLYMGVRVYFSTKNPVYTYCKRIGLHIYDMDSEFDIYRNSILEEDKADENRSILYNIFNEEEVVSRLNTLVSAL